MKGMSMFRFGLSVYEAFSWFDFDFLFGWLFGPNTEEYGIQAETRVDSAYKYKQNRMTNSTYNIAHNSPE